MPVGTRLNPVAAIRSAVIQARDGFVGWRVLDEPLRALLATGGPAEYPIFTMRRIIK